MLCILNVIKHGIVDMLFDYPECTTECYSNNTICVYIFLNIFFSIYFSQYIFLNIFLLTHIFLDVFFLNTSLS